MEISLVQFVLLAVSSLTCIGSAVGIMILLRERKKSYDEEDRRT